MQRESALLVAPMQQERGDQSDDWLTPLDVDRVFRISENTQAVWRSTNRYGFRDLVVKAGWSVRYRRRDVEAWLESRRASNLEAQ